MKSTTYLPKGSIQVHAIVHAQPPQNVSQLRSFLELVSYYGKFLPQLANRLAPLYKRLQKDSQWKWGSDEQQAFDMVKEELTAPRLLVHFDQDRDLVLTL